ncbi:hypothetical protein CSKR_113226 [Clonorchis sinensis]|uniref:Uncharacterized protein n=1 Tax=Clonorchis sinensis TaxID=79923 RepID=A0A419PWR1_CLOSI|nr:hypothetical protein CSKR_113226 [Clonorchis sinensis]
MPSTCSNLIRRKTRGMPPPDETQERRIRSWACTSTNTLICISTGFSRKTQPNLSFMIFFN